MYTIDKLVTDDNKQYKLKSLFQSYKYCFKGHFWPSINNLIIFIIRIKNVRFQEKENYFITLL